MLEWGGGGAAMARVVVRHWSAFPMRMVGIVLAVGGMLAVGGCQKEPSPASPTVLQTRPQPYVPDVPVPAGFDRDERMSNYTSTAGHREVKDVYRGKEQPLVARNFYLHYMPTSGWDLLDEKLQNSVYTLNFRKDQERCEIRIERVLSGSGGGTQVQVIIKPE
jgi:hypothetical protein